MFVSKMPMRRINFFHEALSTNKMMQSNSTLFISKLQRTTVSFRGIPILVCDALKRSTSTATSGTGKRPPWASSSRTQSSAAAASFLQQHNIPDAAPSVLINPSRVQTPSFQELKTLFVASAVPMVGFGAMDNFVMIQAGQYIDSTLGVQLGLATLTAAAAGQVVSDVSGVVFGGSLERALTRMGLIRPTALSTAQRQLPVCRNISMAGAVLGVIAGCALGASTLLFMDLDARERVNRVRTLQDICVDLGRASLQSEQTTVLLKESRAFPKTQLNDLQHLASISLLSDASSASAHACADSRKVVVESETATDHDPHHHTMYIPVLDPSSNDHEVLAVVEIQRSSRHPFREEDLVAAGVVGRHLSIFVDRLSE